MTTTGAKISGWIRDSWTDEKMWICYRFVTNQEPVLLPLLAKVCLGKSGNINIY